MSHPTGMFGGMETKAGHEVELMDRIADLERENRSLRRALRGIGAAAIEASRVVDEPPVVGDQCPAVPVVERVVGFDRGEHRADRAS